MQLILYVNAVNAAAKNIPFGRLIQTLNSADTARTVQCTSPEGIGTVDTRTLFPTTIAPPPLTVDTVAKCNIYSTLHCRISFLN